MCLGGRPPTPPPPPPLAPPPPPPPTPAAPTPPPEPLTSDVDPKVKQAQSKKAKGEQATGTSKLRIKLDNPVNVGTNTPAGGVNK